MIDGIKKVLLLGSGALKIGQADALIIAVAAIAEITILFFI